MTRPQTLAMAMADSPVGLAAGSLKSGETGQVGMISKHSFPAIC